MEFVPESFEREILFGKYCAAMERFDPGLESKNIYLKSIVPSNNPRQQETCLTAHWIVMIIGETKRTYYRIYEIGQKNIALDISSHLPDGWVMSYKVNELLGRTTIGWKKIELTVTKITSEFVFHPTWNSCQNWCNQVTFCLCDNYKITCSMKLSLIFGIFSLGLSFVPIHLAQQSGKVLALPEPVLPCDKQSDLVAVSEKPDLDSVRELINSPLNAILGGKQISLKLLAVGQSGVGKTTYLKRYCNQGNDVSPTVGADFFRKYLENYQHTGIDFQLKIWDVSGQAILENSLSLSNYYQDAVGVFLFCDASEPDSLVVQALKWARSIRQLVKCPYQSKQDIPILLILNKSDLVLEVLEAKPFLQMIKKICRVNNFVGWTFNSIQSDQRCCEEVPNQLVNAILEKISSCELCKDGNTV